MESLWVLSEPNLPESDEDDGFAFRSPFRASETLTWMIERSITTDCITLGSTIAKALFILSSFVRDVREARSDVDGVSRELHSLQNVLDLLKDDAGLFPPELAGLTPALLEHCSKVVDELDANISTLSAPEISKQEKRSQWMAAGRQESARFRSTLEAHKAVLGLALDLVGATMIRDANSETEPSKRNTIERRQNSTDVMEDVSRILVEMGQLRMRLPGEFEKKDFDMTLHDYMSSLKSYAESIVTTKESEHESDKESKKSETEQEREENSGTPKEAPIQGAFVGENGLFGAYVGDDPDSAIDVNVEPLFKTLKEALARNPDEKIPNIDQLMNDMTQIPGDIPSRPPTPPPKDVKRLEAARNSMVSPFESPPHSPTAPANPFGVVTEISSAGRGISASPPESCKKTVSNKSRGFGKFFAPIKNAISENKLQRPRTQSTASTAGGGTDIRPSTPVIQASLVRKGSRRLSVSFKKLPMWNAELMMEDTEGPNTSEVFGVSLQKSIQMAKGTAKTHHSGSKGSSRREFPLCMQKCAFFLKNEGVEAPDIFAEPGDSFRVQKLKETFSRGPTYGEDISWANYGVYDAADLILLYLSQLPRPLISESIAKRWISLSRQATLSGSHANRLDQCIDFWEEALGGLRGPSRSLFKLLLNLWADIAEAADRNDMTAERLASVIIKPLMHISSEKYETDFMLSLSFLIRKRSEYTEMVKKDQSEVKRISRAAW